MNMTTMIIMTSIIITKILPFQLNYNGNLSDSIINKINLKVTNSILLGKVSQN